MGKVLVFIYDDMADYEMTFTCCMLNGNLEHKIAPAAYTMENVKALSNLVYTPVMTIKEALECEDIEGLIIPGGAGNDHRPELTELIKKVCAQGKLTAAICGGPKFLAAAGVLQGKKFTTSLPPEYFKDKNIEDPFNWDNFIKQRVVRDGNIITSTGDAFVDFTAEILDFYNLFENEAEKKEFLGTF